MVLLVYDIENWDQISYRFLVNDIFDLCQNLTYLLLSKYGSSFFS